MKIFRKIKYLLMAIFACAATVLFSAGVVYADDTPEYRIQISPARNDIGDLKPGETYSDIIKVQNTGLKPFNFQIGFTPYYVVDEKYSPDYETRNQYGDIADWIKVSEKTGTVEPNSEVEVAYTITVPADVPAGGQYAMIYAEIAPADSVSDGAGVAVARRVGMLLYSNVEGNTRKTGEVVENKIPSILFNPPVTATSVVSNTGNTHTYASYTLEVYPLFGDEEIYSNAEDPAHLVILPDTRRYNSISWPNAPYLGIFRVKQTVTIFDATSTTEKIVFLCPIWFLFIVLALIFCAIFWIVGRIRARRERR